MSNTSPALRVIYMGTPDFAVPALEALYQSQHEVVAVYSQPPRPKGRGHQVLPSPVDDFASRHDLKVLTPKTLKDEKVQQEFAAQEADIAVVAAYGLILPQAILDAPRLGCLNIHASLLPRWRGASPIQQAILAGDNQTGVTIMKMDAGLDTGPIVQAHPIEITGETTATMLHDRMAQIGAAMLIDILDYAARDGHIQLKAQADSQVTYAPLLKKEDGQIDWSQNAAQIDRQLRALNPWPGTWCMYGDRRIKILAGIPCIKESDAPPGTVLDREGHVVCGGHSALQITKLQPPNAKPMDFISALNGGYLSEGDKFY